DAGAVGATRIVYAAVHPSQRRVPSRRGCPSAQHTATQAVTGVLVRAYPCSRRRCCRGNKDCVCSCATPVSDELRGEQNRRVLMSLLLASWSRLFLVLVSRCGGASKCGAIKYSVSLTSTY
ncbi:unnamed protein product, partial [Pylaiella littoralis]